MAYLNPFDPTTPGDGASAAEGDDRIRELKRALTERLGTFFTNFPDGQPLETVLAGQRSVVNIGIFQDLGTPTKSGEIYWSWNTGEIHIAREDGPNLRWFKLFGDSEIGPLAGRPGVPARMGHLYYASDAERLFVGTTLNGVWKEVRAVSGGMKTPSGFSGQNQSSCAADGVTRQYKVRFTWVNQEPGAVTEIFLAGKIIATAAAGQTELAYSGLTGPGTYAFEARHNVGGNLSSRVPASIAVVDPCAPPAAIPTPTEVFAAETGNCTGGISYNSVRVKWQIVAGYTARIYRSEDGGAYVLAASVSSDTGEYSQGTVAPKGYTFYVAFFNGTTEGAKSNDASYQANNLCSTAGGGGGDPAVV